ncbi:50S ribosomal protein L20 [Patescibacteria group bacterium]|nr:50S ribosomal protein L20 [Patescibacteria group bacterium]
MARVKRGTTARKRRKNVLSHTKGFKWGRKSKYRLAKDALIHAWQYAYRDRKAKKRTLRRQWELQVNAASRAAGVSYSRFIAGLKSQNIELDRKMLAKLANDKPELFLQVLSKTKKG